MALSTRRLRSAVAKEVVEAVVAEHKYGSHPRSFQDHAATLGRGRHVSSPVSEPRALEASVRRLFRAVLLVEGSAVRALQQQTAAKCHICGPSPARVSTDGNLTACQRKSASKADVVLHLPGPVVGGDAFREAVEAAKVVAGGTLDVTCSDGSTVSTWAAAGGRSTGQQQAMRIKGLQPVVCPHEVPLHASIMWLPESVTDHVITLVLMALSSGGSLTHFGTDIACLLHQHVLKQGTAAPLWLMPALKALQLPEGVRVSVRASDAGQPPGVCIEARRPSETAAHDDVHEINVALVVPALHSFAHTCSATFGNLAAVGNGRGDEYVERLNSLKITPAASIARNASVAGYRVHWETVLSLHVARLNEDVPWRLLQRVVRLRCAVEELGARIPALRLAYVTAVGTGVAPATDDALLAEAAAARLSHGKVNGEGAAAAPARAPAIDELVKQINIQVAVSALEQVVGSTGSVADSSAEAAVKLAIMRSSSQAMAALKAVRAGKVETVAAAKAARLRLLERLARLEASAGRVGAADVNGLVAAALSELHSLAVRVHAARIELELARGGAFDLAGAGHGSSSYTTL